MNLLIKNGTIITSVNSDRSDILICNGRIISIDNEIIQKGDVRVIDAMGKYIFPGGIDPHVHMHLPNTEGFSSDDFRSGTRAALFGGTTTIIDFVTTKKGQSLCDALGQRKKEAKDSLIDYSFHVSPVEWRKTTDAEMKKCLRMGVSSFKVYMAYKNSIGLDDPDLFKVMQVAGREKATITVHCEMGDEIENLRNISYYMGHTEPLYHAQTRPAHLEAEAVAKAIKMAAVAGCALYIVHVSSLESLRFIREAKANNQKVFAETCPQYLLLDDSKYEGNFINTAPFVISPPLRSKDDNRALWKAASDGTIDTVGTDHCPFTLDQKKAGEKDFRKIPGGAGGVEHRLELLFTYGVLERRISLNRMVDLFSTLPSKIFGLYPRKGEINNGSDADLVIWDPKPERTISAKTHHQNCDINIYEGMKVRGKADYVIAGGNVMVENGSINEKAVGGKFLTRTTG